MLQCLQLALEATAHHEYEQLFQIELQRMPYLLQAICKYPEAASLKTMLMQATELLGEDTSSASPPSLPPAASPVLVTATSKPLPRLQVYGFGQPTVLLDDKPITHWRMARAMELCFFLLERNKPIHKEKIIAALCSDEDVRADQTFRSAIYYLRKALGEQCVVAQAGCYSIDLQLTYGQNVEYDVFLFQALAQQAKQGRKNNDIAYQALTQMVELYRGDYLQSFYSDWCIFQRDNLRREYMDARHQLALIAWQREQFDESIDHWQHLLALDSCIEEAYQGLMLCYLRQKKRGAALRQYQQCVVALREEMGITPGPELQNLYHRLTGYSDS
jgi:two-component SAPR family response regulator